MTQEKTLLLQDLCARLPYGVEIQVKEWTILNTELKIGHIQRLQNDDIELKPYLRPINSITKEERLEISKLLKKNMVSPYGEIKSDGADNLLLGAINGSYILVYWLLSHHFDYLGLIEKGLAIEAPKDMYLNI